MITTNLCVFFLLSSPSAIPLFSRTRLKQQSHISHILSMAVEARHLNLFPSQLITNRQVIMNSIEANFNLYNNNNNNTHINYSSFPPVTETVIPSSLYNSPGNAVKSESGLTYNNNNNNVVAAVTPASRKRSRDIYNCSFNGHFSFLGQDVSHQIQQQQLDIEHLVTQGMEKVRMEINENRKKQARRIIEAIEVGVMKRLKEKEEEIEKIGKLNWALEERVKSLCMENQIWRDLAQSNEATANALRTNLEQVMAQRAGAVVDGGGGEEMEDAQSCCGSTEEEEDKKEKKRESVRRMCRNCGKEESCVLILPCRHLCLCTLCGSTLHTCPVCKSFKTASVHVNIS
ncbi:hypothetical protein Fmac_018676 [Flemingia macrophylla]|uniref:RING-type E3 ubiquitin transferase n=1 Tax=Flemingia macrophylla TaxID=520843 RepID=A0ABD1M5M7_9FABA